MRCVQEGERGEGTGYRGWLGARSGRGRRSRQVVVGRSRQVVVGRSRQEVVARSRQEVVARSRQEVVGRSGAHGARGNTKWPAVRQKY
jgi:hypothetical protein